MSEIKVNPNKENIEVTIGSSNRLVDVLRNFNPLSLLSKLMLWDWSFNSGNVSPEVIEKMKTYLHERGLHDVKISVNEYDPIQVWQRIFSNPRTSALSKCTLGILTGLFETLTCPKLTGFPGDHFNPAANTVHLFSNHESIALHECGHAEDFAQKTYPSLYQLIRAIPMGTLWQEAQATKNALSHLEAKNDTKGLKKAFKILTPAFATYVVSEATSWPFNVPETLKLYLIVLGAGHVLGRIFASCVQNKPAKQEPLPLSEKEFRALLQTAG